MSSTLIELLPENFDFYHLGPVQALSEATPFVNPDEETKGTDLQGIGYSLQGDVQAAVLLLIPAGLDTSVYSELGNIIASQFADGLAKDSGCDVLVSPPRIMAKAALERLIRGSDLMAKKTYHFLDNGNVVQIEVQILYAPNTLNHD